MHCFAITNQKGGVGKTTTAVNLATAFAAISQRVLLLDFDPQGNASTGLGCEPASRETQNSYAVMTGATPLKDACLKTAIPNLSLLPAVVDLASVDVELAQTIAREFILKKQLETVQDQFDMVLIDTPPSLGLLTINALVAAKHVLVPMQCEFFAMEGLAHLMRTVELVRANLNTSLSIFGIALTMYDRRNKLTGEVEEEVRGHLKEMVFNTVIPRNVRLSEAPSYGKPAILYDHKSPGSAAYVALAKEVWERL